MAVGGLTITRDNVHKFTIDEINSFSSKEYWHKFVIEDAATLDRDDVLKAVLEFLHPVDLVPVLYTISDKDAYFLARNCHQVIEKFFMSSLAPIEMENNVQIKIYIQMCYLSVSDLKVNMQHYLKQALEKRYNSIKGSIDLSAFHTEPELKKILFCPLSRPRFLLYVLSILKKMLPVTSLNLSNNNIEDLKSLEILEGFQELAILDLSHNKVSKISCIELLGKTVPTLKEINLNENPVCSFFQTEKNYLEWIKKCFPLIERIDGVMLNYGLPYQKFWLCDNTYWPLINDFVMQYFTLYDFNREALESMYYKNSIFSITCDNLPIEDFQDPLLKFYKSKSTGFLKLHDKYKIVNLFYFNHTKIVHCLRELPQSQHEPSSFKIDVLQCEKQFIVMVVSGLLKDFPNVRIRNFSRTFILKKVSKDEYKIINDMFHVTNAFKNEHEKSVLNENPNETRQKMVAYLQLQNKEKMIRYLARITKMNLAYSTRCLQEANWNIKKALEIFLENYSTLKIPINAFMKKKS